MRKKVLSLTIDLGSYKAFISNILDLIKSGASSYVCVANVHMLIEAKKSKNFASVVNGADIVTPDGVPLAKSLLFLYGIRQERVAGMDLLPDLLKVAENNQIGIFFYGGTQEMLDRAESFCENNFPELTISGSYSPPFRQLTKEENDSVITKINSSGAKLVLVALGCPKQENWMANMKGKVNACMIGIGGAFPVLVGVQKRAPEWMQKYSLEWLFRLFQEPKRLFKRYLITNSLFIWYLVEAILKERFKKMQFRG